MRGTDMIDPNDDHTDPHDDEAQPWTEDDNIPGDDGE